MSSPFPRICPFLNVVHEPYLLVDTRAQRLHRMIENRIDVTYTISTAQRGIGNRENSLQTPPGVHRIVEKIGATTPLRGEFKDRIFTGVTIPHSDAGPNRILTRILRLAGCEPGINQGDGIESYQRYIYLHGTNREDRIGTPFSHGCILLKNDDIVTLFETVREGTIVFIDS